MTESGETLGEKKRVDLRTVWPHELDFSRWLAENIETLNEQVIWEIDPESARQEVPMGSMRVDLLVEATAPDTGDRFKVVIENQLGMTDGGHLAGVMDYMVAFQAKGAIWIAGDVSHEYVEVVRWLNKESSIDAYLFKVETIRIDESRPVPILTKIAGPSRLPHTGRSGGDPRRSQQVRDWWGRVLPGLAKVHDAWGSVRPTTHQYPGVRIPNGPEPVKWYVNVTGKKTTLGIHISGATRDEGDYYFNQLLARRDEIHDAFGDSLVWDPTRNRPGTRWVTWKNPQPGGFDDAPDVQKQAGVAIADAMKRLVAATEGIVQGLPPFQPPSGDASGESQDEYGAGESSNDSADPGGSV